MTMIATLLAAGAGLFPAQTDPTPEPARAEEPAHVERLAAAMGTTVAIRVDALERADALAASEVALRALEEAERRLSTWQEDSELARFNAAAPGTEVELSAELARELARAEHWRRETGGAFDPAIADLVALWGLREGGRQPSDAELVLALARRAQGTALELQGTTAVRGPLALEEGGFGKGAGLDAALAALAREPIHSASLDLGGQVAVLGGAGTGFTWTLADPRDRLRPVLAYTIESGSVSTSGTSERGAHILDPRSARPVTWPGSMTVWTASALDADCLSKLFVLGPEAALEFARGRDGIEVLVLEPAADGGILARASAGWLGRLEALAADVRLEFDGNELLPAAAATGAPAIADRLQDQDDDDERIARLEAQNAELERRIDSVAGELERFDLGGLVPAVGESEHGMGPAASKVYGVEQGVSLGGYGEVALPGLRVEPDDGPRARPISSTSLRAVLYVGYKFNDAGCSTPSSSSSTRRRRNRADLGRVRLPRVPAARSLQRARRPAAASRWASSTSCTSRPPS